MCKRRNCGLGLGASLFAAVLLLPMVLVGGCGWEEPDPVRETEYMMDTVVTITVMDPVSEEEAHGYIEAAFTEMQRVEALLSAHAPGSEIVEVNDRSGEMVEVSQETFDLIEEALAFAEASEGAFDITVGPLRQRWQAAEEGREDKPGEEEVRELKDLVDYRQVALEPEIPAVGLDKEGMALDLGGVAKGYAVDQAAMALENAGASSAMVDAGGDIAVLGTRPDGAPYRIGVRHPREEGAIAAVLEVEDMRVMTSGDYQRYFMVDGERYHHIIDPGTGYPADSGVVSATVVAESALQADMMATSLVVKGMDEGRDLLDQYGQLQGLMLTEDEERWVSPELEDRTRWE